MRKFFLMLSAAASLAALSSSADAATFTWSYTDDGLNTGSGELDATETAPNSGIFTINSILGIANSFNILFGPFTDFAGTGTTFYWNALAPQFFDPDNQFYFIDVLGFAFSVNPGEYMALYQNTAVLDPDAPGPYACGGEEVPYCLLGPGPAGDGLGNLPIALTNFQVDLLPSEVPLPAALPLMAASMAGLGFLSRRRRRKALV
jgi:hypothetical protein